MLGVVVVEIPAWGSANLIEILWTLFGVLGLALVVPNLWHAINQLTTLSDVIPSTSKRTERDAATTISLGQVRRELLRCSKLLAMCGIGIWAMSQPSAMSPERTTVTGLVITGVFFYIGATIAAQSVFDRLERRRVRRLLAEQVVEAAYAEDEKRDKAATHGA